MVLNKIQLVVTYTSVPLISYKSKEAKQGQDSVGGRQYSNKNILWVVFFILLKIICMELFKYR